MVQRSSYRIPIRLGITYAKNGKAYNGTIKNMSDSGLFVLAEQTDHPEDSIVLELPVKKRTLKMSGRLIRINRSGNNSGFGIRLIDPPQDYIDYIEELLLTL
ncbi:MAG: PilZ domain-containing protein [Nitrospiraceae bacterium]|nr:MAG: PilZ domain-containing protein [Nitrospiraceae bacterium]